MIFTLEVLQADHGDCMLLHYGDPQKPKLIVIDGGPDGIYPNFLKPRLMNIKSQLSEDKALPISMIMVSHLDDDHVNGLCTMLNEMVAAKEERKKKVFDVKHIWLNTFDDIVGNIQIPKINSVAASSAADESIVPEIIRQTAGEDTVAVIASTSQGRQLRDNAEFLGFTINSPFRGNGKKLTLVRGDTEQSEVLFQGLKITVVSPDQTRIERLQKKWDDDLKNLSDNDSSILFASMASLDGSPFNLSSIVCLVEFEGKKILLTGDGRSDHILEGLKKNNLLDARGKLHVDILKMPHHASIRNLKPDFLEAVTADHYVISANGKHKNPDSETFDMFVEKVKKGKIHLTNEEGQLGLGKKTKKFKKDIVDSNSKLKPIFRKSNSSSIMIDLLDKVRF